MLALEFPGSDRLLSMIDAAVALGEERAITDALRAGLCAAMRDPEIQLPACVFEAVADHYARREIYCCAQSGYAVIAMTWGPSQGTPIHDHSGLWCVEGVWHGQIEITQYHLHQQEGDRFKFEAVGTQIAGPGSAGSLIPPHEYHTIRNPSADAIAVSLHIYKKTMTCCSMFQPLGEDWYQRTERKLCVEPS